MKLHTTALPLALALLLVAGCASDETKAREALAHGKQLVAQNVPEEAAALFSEAARLDPRLHEAYARLARVRLGQQRANDAETAALRAASLVPRSSYYSELLGRTQLAADKTDAALASLEQAITLDTTQTARLSFTIGALRERQDKLPEAQASYERAATADVAALPPRLALARLQLRADRPEDAKRRLDEVRLRVPAEGGEHDLFARLDARVTTLLAEREAKRQAEREENALAMRDMLIGNSGGLMRMLGAFRDSDNSRLSDVLGSLSGDMIGDSFGFGGLGLRGTGGSGGSGGMGGGGTGEGTIGLGHIGTIGHGGGTGAGYGGSGGGIGGLGRRRATTVVTPGSTTVVGPIAPEIIQRIARQHMNELRYCYESALARTPTLSGRTSVSFVIGADGAVTQASATGLGDATAEACFASSVRRWAFPAPSGGGVVRVTYPLNLAPAPAAPALP